MEEEGGEWQTCAVGECRVGVGRVVAGTRVIQLAEVVAVAGGAHAKSEILETRPDQSQCLETACYRRVLCVKRLLLSVFLVTGVKTT